MIDLRGTLVPRLEIQHLNRIWTCAGLQNLPTISQQCHPRLKVYYWQYLDGQSSRVVTNADMDDTARSSGSAAHGSLAMCHCGPRSRLSYSSHGAVHVDNLVYDTVAIILITRSTWNTVDIYPCHLLWLLTRRMQRTRGVAVDTKI